MEEKVDLKYWQDVMFYKRTIKPAMMRDHNLSRGFGRKYEEARNGDESNG